MENTKTISIRIPLAIWKRLKLAAIDGRIESIQKAAIDGFLMVLKDGAKRK
jgi:hypothetical protein